MPTLRPTPAQAPRTAQWVPALVLFATVSGCGGCAPGPVDADGGEPGDDAGMTGPVIMDFPVFARSTPIPVSMISVHAVGLSQPGADPVALLFSGTTDPNVWLYPLDGAAPPKQVLTGVAAPVEGVPQVVRTTGGTLHVLWEANGEIHHGTGVGDTGWSTTLVRRGKKPSLGLGADGRVHAAWVGLQSAVWTAFYGSWNGASWDIEAVRSVESRVTWTGVAVMGSTVVLAGTNTDGTLWVAERTGATWVDQPLDVAPFIRLQASHNHAIAAGPAGIAIMFGSDPRSYAAWRPAGATTFQVDVVGEEYTNLIPTPQLRVGNATAVATAAHNQRISAWARSAPYWPRLASFPVDANCASSLQVAQTLDAQDRPVLAVYGCSGELTLYRPVGTYPPDRSARCQLAITQLCDLACACGSGGDCTFVFSAGLDQGGNRSGCELGARDVLCGDSSSPPEELAACVATLQPATCGTLGYPVSDVCLPLIE